MNPAIVREIRDRVQDMIASQRPPELMPGEIRAFGFEMYLRGGVDVLQEEIARVRADTAAKVAATEQKA